MTEIAFYHLERSPLERALPKLLEKTLEAGKRALVVVGSVERV
ncbi:MAG: DNA polymerase III subunit chi, partial [Pseudomonadota bacterium]|nr:DNA polymerase III subunit chi [Pseudomonadota bacterium]